MTIFAVLGHVLTFLWKCGGNATYLCGETFSSSHRCGHHFLQSKSTCSVYIYNTQSQHTFLLQLNPPFIWTDSSNFLHTMTSGCDLVPNTHNICTCVLSYVQHHNGSWHVVHIQGTCSWHEPWPSMHLVLGYWYCEWNDCSVRSDKICTYIQTLCKIAFCWP